MTDSTVSESYSSGFTVPFTDEEEEGTIEHRYLMVGLADEAEFDMGLPNNSAIEGIAAAEFRLSPRSYWADDEDLQPSLFLR